jgi:hypothetical protein
MNKIDSSPSPVGIASPGVSTRTRESSGENEIPLSSTGLRNDRRSNASSTPLRTRPPGLGKGAMHNQAQAILNNMRAELGLPAYQEPTPRSKKDIHPSEMSKVDPLAVLDSDKASPAEKAMAKLHLQALDQLRAMQGLPPILPGTNAPQGDFNVDINALLKSARSDTEMELAKQVMHVIQDIEAAKALGPMAHPGMVSLFLQNLHQNRA